MVVIHCLPRDSPTGQLLPLYAGMEHKKNGVEELVAGNLGIRSMGASREMGVNVKVEFFTRDFRG